MRFFSSSSSSAPRRPDEEMTPPPEFPLRTTQSKSPRHRSSSNSKGISSPRRGGGGEQESSKPSSSSYFTVAAPAGARGRSWVKSGAESFRRVASRRRRSRSRTVEKRQHHHKEPLLVVGTQFDDDGEVDVAGVNLVAQKDQHDKNDSVDDDALSSHYYGMFASSSPQRRNTTGDGFTRNQAKQSNNNNNNNNRNRSSRNVGKGYEPPSIVDDRDGVEDKDDKTERDRCDRYDAQLDQSSEEEEDEREPDYDNGRFEGLVALASPPSRFTYPTDDLEEADVTTRTRNMSRLSVSPRYSISSFSRGRSLPTSPMSHQDTPKMGTTSGRQKKTTMTTTTTVVLSTGNNNHPSSIGRDTDNDDDDEDESATSSWVVRKMLERDDDDHQPKSHRYDEAVDHTVSASMSTNTYTAADSNTFLTSQTGTMETMETVTTRDEETADGRGSTMKVRSDEEDTFLGAPSGDDHTVDGVFVVKQRVAYICIVLTTIQLGILLIQLAMCGMASLKINPLLGPYPDAFSEWGGKNTYLLVEGQQYFRLITPTFLHVGLLHLIANAYCQLETCAYLEREWGSFKWLIIYVFSAIGCCLTASTVDPDTIGVLSSGTLMGMFGAKIAQIFTWSVFELKHSALEDSTSFEHLGSVMCSAATLSLLSFFTYIDWSGHFGGLTTGFLVGMITFSWAIKSTSSKFFWILLALVGLVTGTVFLCIRLFIDTIPDEDLGDACQYFRNLYPEGYECECGWD